MNTYSATEVPTPHWDEVTRYAGRNDLPILLSRHFDDLPDEERPIAVAQAWYMAEWPIQSLGSYEWTDLFIESGLSETGIEGPTVTLYRGAHELKKDGMSWTTSLESATWFASRFTSEGMVLMQLECPVEYLLARIDQRGEHEVVIQIDALVEDDLFHPEYLDLP